MSQVIPETRSDYNDIQVMEKPDGFYWQAKGEARENGPFASYLDAVADVDARGEAGSEPAQAVADAESELGVSDWIDEETGEPAEDGAPRLEQH